MSIAAALSVAKKYRSGERPETHPPLKIKKHIDFQGLKISIETPKGEIRRGIDHEGKPWANKMAVDYGYIQRTEGKDGDQVDVFVGPNRRSDKVFIIDQLHHHMEKFDEHKCLVGFNDKKQALTAYHRSYGRKYGAHHTVGAVTELSIDAFKEWLKGGGGKEPIAPDVPKFQDGGKIAFDPDYLGKYTPDKTPNVRVREGHQEFEKGYVASGRSPWNTDYPYRPILNMRGQELHALKIQEGGVADEEPPVEDVPGVGPVPTTIPEPIKAAAKAYSETPSWLERAQQQTQKSIEAYQSRGVSGLMADTQPTQELAGGFGGTGIAGTIKKAGPEAVHHWSQAIADTLVSQHGADFAGLENALNDLRQATSDRAAVAILAKLPEDVQHELIMRELSRSEGGFGRAEPTATPPSPPAFREITHPEEAMDWLRERGHDPEDWGYSDPENYVELANKMKRQEMGVEPTVEPYQPSFAEQERATRTQQEWDESIQPKTSPTLDEFFGLVSPHEVQHMPENEVLMIHSKLSMAPNANDYQTINPQLWDALHQRIDELDKRTEQTAEKYIDPFKENFEKHIAPLYPDKDPPPDAPWVVTPIERFYHDFFGGMYQPGSIERRYDWDGFYFDGALKDKDGNTLGMITRSFNPETKSAYHEYLKMNPNVRGTGLVPNMIENQINLYRKLGINTVKLKANIDVGSYAWAKYGWIPDVASWNLLRRKFKSYVNSPNFKMTDNYGRDGLLKILNDPDPRAIWDLADSKATRVGSMTPIGKELLSGGKVSWSGTLHLNNADTLARFFEYAQSKAKKGKPP